MDNYADLMDGVMDVVSEKGENVHIVLEYDPRPLNITVLPNGTRTEHNRMGMFSHGLDLEEIDVLVKIMVSDYPGIRKALFVVDSRE